MTTRRRFLLGAGSLSLLAAPAIVRASSLMPISAPDVAHRMFTITGIDPDTAYTIIGTDWSGALISEIVTGASRRELVEFRTVHSIAFRSTLVMRPD